ncbi:MAG: metal ABC transporter substrate-binding protein [candidate division Zixibacteria bacterium]|nr:metal ABC transporter substrate-binding protein [candidate division Zixibacteria bacterium]
MKKIFICLVFLLFQSNIVRGELKIVTTTQDLASIAAMIGGERVKVDFIAAGYQDPHYVDPKPSYLLKLSRADLLIAIGLELEVGWLPALVKDSRNNDIISGKGYLDASTGVDVIEKPTGKLSRSEGDVHPFGNPHFWLDPENGRAMAARIASKLSELDAGGLELYSRNLEQFNRTLDQKLKQWQAQMEPLTNSRVITYHRTWGYFAKRFGLEVAGEIEPKPGIPPSPGHILDLINLIKSQGIRLILIEPFYDPQAPQSVSEKSGARVLILPNSVGGVEQVKSYFDLFDYNINQLTGALK